MKFLLQWPLSLLHIFFFSANLLLLHIPLMIARIFGQDAMDSILHLHCYFHVLNTKLLGSKIEVTTSPLISNDKPLVLVSNHQSMYDIPFIIWHLRTRNPKFISKKELAKFIPSISFALRNGGHILIDRKRAKEAIKQIKNKASKIAENIGATCIFPEGTRSKTGELGKFKVAGFQALLKGMKDATIVPVVISGTGKVTNSKFFPAPIGSPVHLSFLDPINYNNEQSAEQILAICREEIEQELQRIQAFNSSRTVVV